MSKYTLPIVCFAVTGITQQFDWSTTLITEAPLAMGLGEAAIENVLDEPIHGVANRDLPRINC